MLAQSEANLESIKQEKAFLVGNIFYFSHYLPQINGEPEVISNACEEIVNYLSELLVSVNLEEEIINAINRYLYSLCNDWRSFKNFEFSPEFSLFKEIFELLDCTYAKRVKAYMWYLMKYKNYVDTNRISKGYKIISKQEKLSKEKYAELLKIIPKV